MATAYEIAAAENARKKKPTGLEPDASGGGGRAAVTPPQPGQGSVGRTLGDAIAFGTDYSAAPAKAVLDVANRALVGARNVAADAVGAKNVEPATPNYSATQDALLNLRRANATPSPVSTVPGATTPTAADANARLRPLDGSGGGGNTRIQPWNSPSSDVPHPVAVPAANGGLGLVRGMTTYDGRPGGVASSIDKAVVRTYDNASIARIQGRAGAPTNVALGAGTAAANDGAGDYNFSRMPVTEDAAAYQSPNLGNVASSFGAPNSEFTRSENMRRAEIAATDPAMRGFTNERMALVQSYLDQNKNLDAINASNINANATAATQAQAGEIAGAQGQQKGRNDLGLQRLQNAGDLQKLQLSKELTDNTVTGADGSLGLLRNGRVVPVIGSDGKPFKAAPTKSEGSVTQSDQYKAYNDALNEASKTSIAPDGSFDQNAYDQRVQALQQDPRFVGASFVGAAKTAATPNLADFVKAARAANSKMTDDELAAAFKAKYGQ